MGDCDESKGFGQRRGGSVAGCGLPVLDVRAAEAFARGHRVGAASIPLEELSERVHELPADRTAALLVFDDDPARAARACAWLAERGHRARVLPTDEARGVAWEAGPPAARLWRPHPALARWLPLLRERAPGRRALDLACGAGREAVTLAEAGFAIEAIDHDASQLSRAERLAERVGVGDRVTTRVLDLEAPGALVDDPPYDLVIGFRFLWRPLFPAIAAALAPGGLLAYQTFDVRERDRSGRPSSPRHLLEPGELLRLVTAAGLEVVCIEEGVDETDRFLQGVVAVRPPPARSMHGAEAPWAIP